MGQQTVPIPGEILKTTVILGLTFDELLVLAALPLVLVLPSAMIDQIPLWFSLVTVAIGVVAVLGIVYKTPNGQSPTEWFPAYLDRKIKPNRYVLKPKDNTKYGSAEVNYQDVVNTANLIESEDEPTPEMVEGFINDIEGADKLEHPEWAGIEEKEEDGGIAAKALNAVKP